MHIGSQIICSRHWNHQNIRIFQFFFRNFIYFLLYIFETHCKPIPHMRLLMSMLIDSVVRYYNKQFLFFTFLEIWTAAPWKSFFCPLDLDRRLQADLVFSKSILSCLKLSSEISLNSLDWGSDLLNQGSRKNACGMPRRLMISGILFQRLLARMKRFDQSSLKTNQD